MISRSPLNLGIIGCGERAREHLQAYKNLFRPVACCDLRREVAEALRSEWHFGAAYTDAGKLLRRNDIDLVLLLTPPTTYPELIPAAAQAGKHIYIEGPLAMSQEDARRVLEACQAAAVHLGIAPSQRALPRIVAAKQVLESGLLGSPFLVHWETACLRHWPPSSTAEAVPHLLLEDLVPEIDVLCFLLQQPVREVYARAGRAPFRPASNGGGETWALLTLTLAQGVVAQMFHSWDCQNERRAVEGRFHLECTHGALFVNEEGPESVVAYLAEQKAWLHADLPEGAAGMRHSMEEFLDRVAERAEPGFPTSDQLQALEAAWAIAASLQRNVPVTVQSLWETERAVSSAIERAAPAASRPRRRFRRGWLPPEDLSRYLARPVLQADPPVLVLSALPAVPSERRPDETESGHGSP